MELQELELHNDSLRSLRNSAGRSVAELEIGAFGRDMGFLEFQKWAAMPKYNLMDLVTTSQEKLGAAYCIFRRFRAEIPYGNVSLRCTLKMYDVEIRGAL
ncbi:hypothetical protein GcM3_104025 [Golovinomyces cichoracearum]|uniref:Uncharacterized protein n=1 Tax=Golovinomyces cichoracearum TaxID=62708 RepID=A0A420I9Y0_9PEZI|nr:hypothetical protein GcM3_104025 [Golovinomyces cichoracearum]